MLQSESSWRADGAMFVVCMSVCMLAHILAYWFVTIQFNIKKCSDLHRANEYHEVAQVRLTHTG